MKFGFWERLGKSFWSRDAYQAVASSSVGSALGYLGLLSMLVAIVVAAQAQWAVGKGVGTFKQEKWWERNLPEIRIAKGKASSPAPQPFTYRYRNDALKEEVVVIVDTTGQTTQLEPALAQGILLTDTKLIVRQNQRGMLQTREIPLERWPDMTINQVSLEQCFGTIATWTWLVVWLCIVWLWSAPEDCSFFANEGNPTYGQSWRNSVRRVRPLSS